MRVTDVMRSGQQTVRSLHPSELWSLARNDQVNCRCSVPAGPRWLFNLMSYCRRPLERDVYTATSFRAVEPIDRSCPTSPRIALLTYLPSLLPFDVPSRIVRARCAQARVHTRICDSAAAGISMMSARRSSDPSVISRHRRRINPRRNDKPCAAGH